jgi:hypothetical protein
VRTLAAFGCALVCLCAAEAAWAQLADSTEASEFYEAPLAGGRFALIGDLRLRAELVDNVPNRPDQIHRERATLRAGVRWTPAPLWAAELSGKASLGSDRNEEFFPLIDNEAPDTIDVDRANVRFGSESALSIRAGRIVMPLRLSEMTWDKDLRPWGTAATGRWAVGALDVVRAGVAVVNRDEAELEPTLVALQGGWSLREGAERSGEVVASLLVFDNEDLTVANRLARQNRVGPDGSVEDMTVGSLRLEARTAFAGVPVLVGVDGVENFRADTDRLGVRTRLRVGSAREQRVEVGGTTSACSGTRCRVRTARTTGGSSRACRDTSFGSRSRRASGCRCVCTRRTSIVTIARIICGASSAS